MLAVCKESIFQNTLPPRGRGRFFTFRPRSCLYVSLVCVRPVGAGGVPWSFRARWFLFVSSAFGRQALFLSYRSFFGGARKSTARPRPLPCSYLYVWLVFVGGRKQKAPPAPGRQRDLKYRHIANGQQPSATSPCAAKIHPAPHNFTAPDATTPDNAHNFPLPMSAAAAHNFPRVDVRRC